jgi:hypothetical protein
MQFALSRAVSSAGGADRPVPINQPTLDKSYQGENSVSIYPGGGWNLWAAILVAPVSAAQPPGVTGISAEVGSDSNSLELGNGQAVPVKIHSATMIKVMGKLVSGPAGAASRWCWERAGPGQLRCASGVIPVYLW